MRRSLDSIMSQLPYVLLVLFAMPDGGHTLMETTRQYDSPTSCNVRALIENEQVTDRTYMCVTRDNTEIRLGTSRHQASQASTRK